MKKVMVAAGILVVAVGALRRFGPVLGERAMKKCEEMFDRMPEEFPPKRMMRGIEEIEEQTTRIARDLDERGARARAPAGG